MNTVIDLLTRQHGDVLAHLATAEGHLADRALAADFIAFLDSEVVSHFRLEEEVLFPELAQIPTIAAGPLHVMNAEHETFRSLLEAAKLSEARADLVGLSTTLTDLINMLRSHISKEDGVLFPLAEARLSPEQLQRIEHAAV
jgi:iron-sulfur cluster repair protein YtfE (RIC family)